MILRIVRMEFQEGQLDHFHQLFNQNKEAIRSFEGCFELELHEDAANPFVRYTYSKWNSEAALEAYRHSPLFQQLWPKTKALFAERPQAYSLVLMEKINPSKEAQ